MDQSAEQVLNLWLHCPGRLGGQEQVKLFCPFEEVAFQGPVLPEVSLPKTPSVRMHHSTLVDE